MGRFVLLNAPGRGPKTGGQAQFSLSKLRKILEIWARRSSAAAKWIQLQAEVVETTILRLMANGPLFYGFC